MDPSRIGAAFVAACEWDVAARKAGNVSEASPGHGMAAAMFRASAAAAVAPLTRRGARIGERVRHAVEASWAAAGCNTNLGILLLCAPLARAAEGLGDDASAAGLHAAVQAELAALDIADAAAAFAAITRANPGGLGQAEAEDVHAPPSVTLREAMALAADRDLIARQFAGGYAELFATGLPALPPGPVDAAAVQRIYLAWLGNYPDSHIVRKHGQEVAQTVMQAAQGWAARDPAGADAAAWAAWDEQLKAARINPGTSADLTVATLMAALLLRHPAPGPAWHGS